MHKIKTLLTFHFVVLTFLASALLSGLTVMALDSETDNQAAEATAEANKKAEESRREAAKQEFEAKREAAKQEFETKREAAKDRMEAAKTRLEETKLRICEDREDKIDSHMDGIAERGQKKIDLFNTIAERVKSFYFAKGKTLSNYDELVAAVDGKKAAAQAAVDEVIASSVTFDCGGDDPKGMAGEFKTKVKAMNDVLKEFRTAVKDLIVGVKSVQSMEGDD